jgi:hypothetical protein
MLKEYSGKPPPRISSKPGTPVGKRRMATRPVLRGAGRRVFVLAIFSLVLERYSFDEGSSHAS